MKDLIFTIPIAATTAKTAYVPVPCRGTVKQVYAVYSKETDKDETVTVSRGSDDVNVVTPPADATAAGVKMAGTPDSTNGDLVFDPDSDTAANQVLKIGIPNTFDTAGDLALHVEFDIGAFIEETPLDA